MEKSRPKRLLGLIKKKQPDSQPSKAPSPSATPTPKGKPSSGPEDATKVTPGPSSIASSKVTPQAPDGARQKTTQVAGGVQEQPTIKDRTDPATPAKQPQSDGKPAASATPPKQAEPITTKNESTALSPAASPPAKEQTSQDSSKSSLPLKKDVAPAKSEESTQTIENSAPPPRETGSSGSAPSPQLSAPENKLPAKKSGAETSIQAFGKEESKSISEADVPADTKEQAEDQSLENWLRYQALADLASDYVFLIKRDGIIERVGQPVRPSTSSAGEVCGNEAGDTEGEYLRGLSGAAGLVASFLKEHGKSYINRARQEKTIQDFDFDATIGGRRCHFASRLTVTEKGEIVAVVRDCTGETLLHTSLSEAERYRQLLDRTVDGMLVVDVQTSKVRVCNESAASIFGCRDTTELVGADFLEFVCEEDRERISELIEEQVSDVNSGQTLEFRIVRKDGTEAWVRAGVSSADWSGALARLISMADVTELKRTEDALHQSEERFDGLIRTTGDWVWEINTEGAYTYASPRVRDILGYEPEEVLGKTPLDLMAREEAERIVNDFVSLLSTREPFDGLDVVCLHKDGHAVSITKSGVPFFEKEGKLLGYRGVDRNVGNGTGVLASGGRADKASSMIEGMIQVITSIMETRDRYTAMHQQYVARLAADIATELGLTKEQVQSVRIAALLHDIGKMCIPAEILNKPSQLSRVESDILRSHPRAGYDILKNIEFPWPVGQMVLQHHERMNGSGYPSGLKGDEILPEARILAVADVVVAMSSHRPYRPAQSLEKALREVLENRGTLYDSVVVDACLTLASRKGFSFQEESDALLASPIEHGVTSGCAGLAFGL